MAQMDQNDAQMTGTKKTGLMDKVGEAVEKAGKVIGQAAPSVGKKIHDLGDKLETTHKAPNHPDGDKI